ncbi:DUF6483 family protein [Clostridium sp.]|uniref:DUF6483 family protein n=1 Tax=Clostridium sp. TaxID=1506 RepID=UPI002608E4C2|nr:DUF6483 family protein [Clostridium sp.]
MDIEKLIQELGKSIGNIICNKKEENSEKINIEQMTSTDIFKIIFIKAVHEGNYNKAENLIFDELETNYSDEIYKIAIEFYKSLLEKSNELLNQSNFSREEIYQGLKDIQKFKEKL